ncbi:MAG: MarR family winged helix-turn-helix transcriptional regulator [Lautropia sp.]
MRTVKASAPDGHAIWDRPGYLVRRLHQIHVAMFLDRVAGGQITPVQFGLLSILAKRPGIDQFTIGAELGLDRANVADIIKRLESRALVARVVDAGNRRRRLCRLTPQGRALLRRHEPAMQASQEQLLAPLAAPERALFMELLSRLVEGNNDAGRTSLRPDGRALARQPAASAAPPRSPASTPPRGAAASAPAAPSIARPAGRRAPKLPTDRRPTEGERR